MNSNKEMKPTIDNVRKDREKYFEKCDGKASRRIKNIIDDILSKDVNTNTV